MILSVGESRPKHFKLGAWAIRKFEKIDHSHSFTSFRDPRLDIRKVGEARGSGGRLITNQQFRSENEVVRIFQYEVTQETLDLIEKWLWDHLRPYSRKHLLGLLIMRIENSIYRLFDRDKLAKNRFKDGLYSLICIEMTAYATALATGQNVPNNIEDFGLREFHQLNYENYRKGLCKLAPDEMIRKINSNA